ncbi:MAG: OmpH family outer membrane protein [Desulforhopalus sp.]
MVSQRTLLAGLISLMLCFAASNCFSADLKIGVMNVQKIIVGCDAGKAAKERFDKKMKELQSTFKSEEEALKELQAEIKKKSSAWSEEKRAEKVREFQKSGRELQAKTEDARFEMKNLQDKELEPILKALEKVVDQYGKDNGFTAIMDAQNGVVYFDKSVDISDAIVKKLNGALAKK